MGCKKSDKSRYQNTPGRKQTIIGYVDKIRKKRMLELIAMFGGKCQRCDYSRCSAALDFHHRDPATKLFMVNVTHMTKGWNRILAEAAKCDLLCANCHREEHAAEWTFTACEEAAANDI